MFCPNLAAVLEGYIHVILAAERKIEESQEACC
jgi:hypothetical protein